MGNYLAESEEVMSLREGDKLTVLDEGTGDWCLARSEMTQEEGWVPRAYLATEEQYDERLEEQLQENISMLPTTGLCSLV